MINGVKKVVVPVDDQERAKRFWIETMGFEESRDETYGDERWIEVSPPDASVALVLSPRNGAARPDLPLELPHSPIFFDADDVEATYRELRERGVRFPQPPKQMHFGWWALFEDPDGTRYALGRWGG